MMTKKKELTGLQFIIYILVYVCTKGTLLSMTIFPFLYIITSLELQIHVTIIIAWFIFFIVFSVGIAWIVASKIEELMLKYDSNKM